MEITNIIFSVNTIHVTKEAFKKQHSGEVRHEARKLEQQGLIRKRERKIIEKCALEEVGRQFDSRKTFMRAMLYKSTAEILKKEVKRLKRKLEKKEESKVYLRQKMGCQMCVFAKKNDRKK